MRTLSLTLSLRCAGWLALGLLACVTLPAGPRYRVASFNIRFENSTDNAAGRSWTSRRPLVTDMIKKYDFDIFGTQEGEGRQIDHLQADLPAYGHFGISRERDYANEHSSIFYKRARFLLLQSGDYWNSATPDEPSKSWDATFRMITTWGKFQDLATGHVFFLFNTHFDPDGAVAKQESAKLLLAKIAEFAGEAPVLCTGDFNANQSSAGYALLRNSGVLFDSYLTAATRLKPTQATFNNWVLAPTSTSRIDHIFTTAHFRTETHDILTDNYDGKLPSDHFPVLIVTELTSALPGFTTHPLSQTVAPGSSVTFTATPQGIAPFTYQWRKDGQALSGATAGTLTLPALTTASAGDYTVQVGDRNGFAFSRPARLVVAAPEAGRLSNLSCRALAGIDGLPLIVGFVMGGGAKPVLLRGVGPTLLDYGVSTAEPDPALRLYDAASAPLGANDDWGGTAELAAAFARLGAVPLAAAASKDAALLAQADGLHSVHVAGKAGASKVVLVEVYDAGAGESPRLINLSARNFAGTGEGVLILGFALTGNAPANLLIRGVGPQLADYGVGNVLADPRIELIDGRGVSMAANDDWQAEDGGAAVLAATRQMKIFELRAGGKDAALFLPVPAGLFTVKLSGVNDITGQALIEIYEVR